VVEEPEDFRAHRLVHRVGTWQESHKTIFVTTDATKASPEGCLDSWR